MNMRSLPSGEAKTFLR